GLDRNGVVFLERLHPPTDDGGFGDLDLELDVLAQLLNLQAMTLEHFGRLGVARREQGRMGTPGRNGRRGPRDVLHLVIVWLAVLLVVGEAENLRRGRQWNRAVPDGGLRPAAAAGARVLEQLDDLLLVVRHVLEAGTREIAAREDAVAVAGVDV